MKKSKIILGLSISTMLSGNCYAAEGSYFISEGVGMSNYGIFNKTKVVLSENTTSTNSVDYEIGFGYKMNKSFFTTINIQKSKLDNIKFNYLYTAFNYNFLPSIKGTQKYIGLIAGAGKFKWTINPIETTSSFSDETKRIIYGAQIGFAEKISQYVSTYIEFKHIRGDFATLIDETKLVHEYQNKISGGIRYDF